MTPTWLTKAEVQGLLDALTAAEENWIRQSYEAGDRQDAFNASQCSSRARGLMEARTLIWRAVLAAKAAQEDRNKRRRKGGGGK